MADIPVTKTPLAGAPADAPVVVPPPEQPVAPEPGVSAPPAGPQEEQSLLSMTITHDPGEEPAAAPEAPAAQAPQALDPFPTEEAPVEPHPEVLQKHDQHSLLSAPERFVGQIVGGTIDATKQSLHALDSAAQWLNENVADLTLIKADEPTLSDLVTGERHTNNIGDTIDAIPTVRAPETTAESMVRSTSQFMAAFLPWNRAAKLATAGKAVIAAGEVAGAVVSATAFDPHDPRLSNLINDMGGGNAVTEFLAAKPGDTEAEGRLKNALEGIGISGALHVTMYAAKSLKSAITSWRAGDQAAADAAWKQGKEMVDAYAAKQSGTATPEQLNLFESLPTQNSPAKIVEDAAKPTTTVTGKPSLAPLAENKIGVHAEDVKAVQSSLRAADGTLPEIGPHLGITTEEVARLRANIKAAGEGTMEWDEALSNIPMNVTHWTGPDDVKLAEEMLMREMADYLPADITSVQKHSEVSQLAELMGQSPADVLTSLHAVAEQSEKIVPTLIAAKAVKQSLLIRTSDVARAVDAGLADEALFDKMVHLSLNTSIDIKRVSQMGARVTSAGNINVGPLSKANEKAFDAALTNVAMTGDKKTFIHNVAQLNKQPTWIAKAVNAAVNNKGWDVVNEVWINAILSGTKTTVTNVASNVYQMVAMPLEEGVGAALRGDWGGIRDAAMTYAGMKSAVSDSLSMAWKAFKKEDNILDAGHKVMDRGSPKAAIAMQGDSRVATAVNGVGNVVRLPSRFLLSQDEFFKQINYRAKVYSLAVGDAVDKNLSRVAGKDSAGNVIPSQFDQYVEQRLKDGFDANGKATVKEALDYAQESTFTQDLLPNSLPKAVQDAAVKVPVLRQVIPFVKTPTNLIVTAGQHVPAFGLLSKQIRADLASGNPRRMNAAIGKQAVGGAILAGTFWAAAEGKLTGNGPKDPNMRKTLEGTGWQSNSIHVGGEYLPYDRLPEPLSSFLMAVANTSEIAHELTDHQYETLAGAHLMSLMSAIGDAPTGQLVGEAFLRTARAEANKSYLQSVNEILQVIESDSPTRARDFINRRAGSMVPYSSLMRQTSTDPYVREVKSLVDAARSNIWWASEGLPKKFNFLGQPEMKKGTWLGRAVSPMNGTEDKGDPLWNEVRSMGVAMNPPLEKIGNVDLTGFKSAKGKDAYERYNELIGGLKIDGQNLEGSLRSLIDDPAYQARTNAGIRSGSLGAKYNGTRAELFRGKVDMYRGLALEQLKKEGFVSADKGLALSQALNNDENNRIRTLRGDAKKTSDLFPLK